MSSAYNVWRFAGLPPLLPLQSGQNLYVLVDGAQVDDYRKNFRAIPGAKDRTSLAGPDLTAERENVTQHLLRLKDLDALKDVLARVMRSSVSHGAMSVMVSSLTTEELAAALRRRLDVTLPDQFDCINRFFDGRVAPHWLSVLRPEQRTRFTAFASQWWVVSHEHVWTSLNCGEIHPDPFDGSMTIIERQQADMIDACYPYSVIDHFEQTDPELLERVPPAAQYGWFQRALEAARRYGIDDGPESMLFCTLTLTRGERFFDAPQWREGLQRVQLRQTRLRDLMKAIHD
jgi:hypothetical protein